MSLNKSSVKKVWASVIWTYEKKTKIIKIINSWTTGVTLEDELLFCLLFFSTNNCLDLHLTANETDNSKTLLVSESKDIFPNFTLKLQRQTLHRSLGVSTF